MQPVNILVVDDESDLEYLMNQKFRARIAAGELALFYAENGQAALQQLEAHPDISIVFTDIQMPEMDGLTLLTHLHTHQTPVCAIVISAYGDITNIRAAMNRGAYDFLTKPIDFADLEATLNKAIEHIREQRALRRAIHENVRQYHMLAEKFGDGLAVVQHDKIVLVNPALCNLLDMPQEALLHASSEVFRQQPANSGTDTKSFWQCRHITSETRDQWLEIHAEDIVWHNSPARLLTIHDVTARVHYELLVLVVCRWVVAGEYYATYKRMYSIWLPYNIRHAFAHDALQVS